MGRLFTVKLWFTKLNPPVLHGLIPNIGRRRLMERLGRLGVLDLERHRAGEGRYWVELGGGYALEIVERRAGGRTVTLS